jgi:hypothetical protein
LWQYQKSSGESRSLLWVESICINQIDTAEKNAQVSIIGDIFLLCEEVLVWLGREADGSAVLLKYFIAMQLIGLYHPVFGVGRYLPELSVGQLKALVKLAQRDYWRRTWIVQEIYMKRSPIFVYCKDQKMPLEWLRKFSSLVVTTHPRHRFAIDPDDDCLYLKEVKTLLRELETSPIDNPLSQTAFNISSLVQANRDMLYADPRDKICAFRSLAIDINDSKSLPIDYNKDVSHLY